jgi:DNA-binding NarL/FixJ family response regulator
MTTPPVANPAYGPHAAQPLVALEAGDEVAYRRVALLLRAAGMALDGWAGDDAPVVDAIVTMCGDSILARGTHLRELRRRDLPWRIVVVMPFDSPRGIRSALEAGADGVVFEPELDQALVPTLRAVFAGQVAVPSVARRQVGRPILSRRERETLALVVMGLTNAEIGARLYLAESTVKSHLCSAFAKLGVRSRNEAAALILDPAEGLGPGILDLAGAGLAVAGRAAAAS